MEPQETNEMNAPETVKASEHTTPVAAAHADHNKKQSINIVAAVLTCIAMIVIAVLIIMHPGSKAAAPSTGATAPTTPTTIPADVATVRPSDADHVRGDLSKAQILIFEYSDSDCPYCVKFHPTLQQVVKDYNGKVAWIYRFYPLTSLHPDAYNEALALQCAGELGGAKVFNDYLDNAIGITVNPGPQGNKTLTMLATQQGLDAAKFTACIADPATATAVDNGMEEAQSIGAQGTPFSVVVNIKTGKQIIIPGAYPIDEVKKDIDSLLK